MSRITAVVLAAGKSMRMGRPKMTLPWGEMTVIENVVRTLQIAGLESVFIVCGDNLEVLKEILKDYQIKFVYNKDYFTGEMLSSVKVALNELERGNTEAALIVLGDQPQIEVDVVKRIIDTYELTGSEIIVPSYQFHRGHPWLVNKKLWKGIFSLKPKETMRNFLSKNRDLIFYIEVKTPSILLDIDTPDEYENSHP